MRPGYFWSISAPLFGVVTASALLSSCASVTPLPQSAQAVVFERVGRVFVFIKAEGPDGQSQQFTAGFWAQIRGAEDLLLRLTDPLGNVQAEVLADTNNSVLRLPNRAPQSYSSFSELSKSLTGVALPRAAWRYWLMGQLDPGFAGSQRKNDQQQIELTQHGFVIVVSALHLNGTPRVINITRPDRPELVIRLAIEESLTP